MSGITSGMREASSTSKIVSVCNLANGGLDCCPGESGITLGMREIWV